MEAEFGRLGLRRPGRGLKGPAIATLVLPKTLVALLVIGVLFVAASWVDAGRAAPAASPDPHPSAKKSNAPAPAPDDYQPPVSQPSAPAPAPSP